MKHLTTLMLLLLSVAIFSGCGSSGGDSAKPSGSAYVHEREFALDDDFYALPEQVITIYLESMNDPGPADEDTGGVGNDLLRIKLEAEADHEFSLQVPDGERFSMTVVGPDGEVVAMLDANNPTATVDVKSGIHSLAIYHGGGSDRHQALFVRGGSTIVGKDCPDCDLAGINLKNHNLSNADITGADLSGANLSHADLTGSTREQADLSGAILTGAQGFYPAPATGCTEGDDCYTVYPAACPWSSDGLNGTDYAQITFRQCNASGSNSSINSVTIGHKNDNPVGITLPDGTYWQVTIEDNHEPQPFNTFITASNADGWTYFNGCDQSAPPKANNTCGGGSLIETTSGKDIRTLCVPKDNSLLQTGRTYLLDMMNGNYLFRGALPCTQNSTSDPWKFDFDGLIAGMSSCIAQQVAPNATLPKKFTLIDVSLINNGSESTQLLAEYEFFGGQGNNTDNQKYQPAWSQDAHAINATVDGRLLWWNLLPLVSGAQNSDLQGLAHRLGELMSTNSSVSGTHYVIYIHCASGQDRTGEAAISYLLENRKMASADAFVYGTTIFNQANQGVALQRFPPHDDYLVGAAWYDLMRCNDNSTQCAELLSPYQSGGTLDTCLNYKAQCASCTDIKVCYDFSNGTELPGSKAFPNEYPWSTDHDWAAACSTQ